MMFLGLTLGLVIGISFNVHEIKKAVEQCLGHSASPTQEKP
jgi:hypothetical protein